MSLTAHSSRNHTQPAPQPALPAPAALAVPVSEPSARLLAVVGITAIAVIHILDAVSMFSGARYIFWLYMAIVIGVIPVSLALLHWNSPLAWIGVAALAAGPLLGYVLTRTVGLPADSGDIGNWVDTLGLASMFVEASVLSLALTRLTLSRYASLRSRGAIS